MEKYTFSNFTLHYSTSFFIIVNSFFVKICVILYYNDVDKIYQNFYYCCVRVHMSCVVGPTPSLAPPNETPCSRSSVVT